MLTFSLPGHRKNVFVFYSPSPNDMVFRFVPANEMEEAMGDMPVPLAGMMYYMSSLAMTD